MHDIINKLILVTGAWNDTGRQDKRLEREFDSLLNELREVAKTTREGALELLVESLGEVGVAA